MADDPPLRDMRVFRLRQFFPAMSRWLPVLVGVLLLCVVYQGTFRMGFLGDDFAWLSMKSQIYDFHSAVENIFGPRAQGTVRFLSDRLFFILPSYFWPNNPIPLRIIVFLTQIVNIVFICRLSIRLTGSLLAATVSVSLWLLNLGVSVAMCWLTTYNQLLLSALLSSALYFFVTGRNKLCWICFLLAFGALESNLMFPVILVCYATLLERKRLREAVLFFIPSFIFGITHWLLIPKSGEAVYSFHVGTDLLNVLWKYWKLQLSFDALVRFHPSWQFAMPFLVTISSVVIATAFTWRLLKKDNVPAFFLLWWFLLLAPVLPLSDHISDYYLASPGVGFSLMMGSLIRGRIIIPRIGTVLVGCIVLLIGFSGWMVCRGSVKWYRSQAETIQTVVHGVLKVRSANPEKIILLRGVDRYVFGFGLLHAPFVPYGVGGIFIDPSESILREEPASLAFSYSKDDFGKGMKSERLIVLKIEKSGLIDVTKSITRSENVAGPSTLCQDVDVGDVACGDQLGSGWYAVEAGDRWMGAVGEVRLGVPVSGARLLRLKAWSTPHLLVNGPVTVIVFANESIVGKQVIRSAGELQMLIPVSIMPSVGSVYVRIQVSRTVIVPPDSRRLSLIFGHIALE